MSDSKVEIVTVEGEKKYKCPKCTETSRRRFNVERHHKRFHEQITPQKMCCGIIFSTKSDFYDHKERVHDEKKKYFKEQDRKCVQSPDTIERRIPLENMDNIFVGRRTTMKYLSRKIKLSNSSSSKKENVKIYNITDTSKEGLDRGLNSIEF